jgi:hypothetical protein
VGGAVSLRSARYALPERAPDPGVHAPVGQARQSVADRYVLTPRQVGRQDHPGLLTRILTMHAVM